MKPLEQLVRPNIWSLAPYSSARDEYSGKEAHIFLDAQLSKIKGVPVENIFLGNGSDEAIDLAYRIFCEPGRDNVVSIAPTYGMYKVCADINNVECRQVLLDEHYQFHAADLLAACDSHTKIIWLCSPNNPTGNSLNRDEMLKVVEGFDGIVVVEDIINIYNKVKYPYNVNLLTQQQASEMLRDPYEVDKTVKVLLQERARLMLAFQELPICQQVFPTDANFFLARMSDAQKIYDYLVERGIIVRNRSRIQLCDNCLRITIGTRSENNELVAALRQF